MLEMDAQTHCAKAGSSLESAAAAQPTTKEKHHTSSYTRFSVYDLHLRHKFGSLFLGQVFLLEVIDHLTVIDLML